MMQLSARSRAHGHSRTLRGPCRAGRPWCRVTAAGATRSRAVVALDPDHAPPTRRPRTAEQPPLDRICRRSASRRLRDGRGWRHRLDQGVPAAGRCWMHEALVERGLPQREQLSTARRSRPDPRARLGGRVSRRLSDSVGSSQPTTTCWSCGAQVHGLAGRQPAADDRDHCAIGRATANGVSTQDPEAPASLVGRPPAAERSSVERPVTDTRRPTCPGHGGVRAGAPRSSADRTGTAAACTTSTARPRSHCHDPSHAQAANTRTERRTARPSAG